MSWFKVLIVPFLLGSAMVLSVLADAQQDAPTTTRKITNRAVPVYPELARAMNVKGIVRLDVSVAPNGAVRSVKVVGGHPLLVQAAERAVQKWRWEQSGRESTEAIELRFNPE